VLPFPQIIVAFLLAFALSGAPWIGTDFGCADACVSERLGGPCSSDAKQSAQACCACGCAALTNGPGALEDAAHPEIARTALAGVEGPLTQPLGGHIRRVFTPPRG
jgi:hypothetical protein